MSLSDPIQIAADFVNSTSRHIFLTGKAGTGKTTFLRELAERTHKEFIICAPTGIAALNAKGVTIHSQFLLPFGSFIPDPEYRLTANQERGFYTREILFRTHTLNAARKKVLQSLELLIIDEVSMLRADVLDAIDVRLRTAKNNWNRSFGGVQVLFIGDMFQLPPVVKDHERGVMAGFYPSIHFFNAHALRHSGFVYVELQKVFRQTDDVFLDVLNHLRRNQITAEHRRLLNEHFHPDSPQEDGVITLATHNRQVDEINRRSLDELDTESHFFTAEIEGDFPESMYPCEVELELKVRAQVMFIKNDSSMEKRYFNGKLAKVTRLENDEIVVILDGETEEFIVPEEKWENTRYSIEEDDLNPEQKVVGAFYQYPIKLAWAVTIHKSQGLTFDKAIIDVGRAFAPGQVYVALSRLRSLDGLILRTPVPASSVENDPEVVRFTDVQKQHQDLEKALDRGRSDYVTELVVRAFDLDPVERRMYSIMRGWPKELNFNVERLRKWPDEWKESFGAIHTVSQTFKSQLYRLIREGDRNQIFERLDKGVTYFDEQLRERLKMIYGFLADIQRFRGTRKMTTDIEEVELMLVGVLKRILTVNEWTRTLLAGGLPEKKPEIEKALQNWRKEAIEAQKERARTDESLKGAKRTRKGKKKSEGVKSVRESTYSTTYKLVDLGKSIEEIAVERELTEATVVGHVARGISTGRLKLSSLMDQDLIHEMVATYNKQPTLRQWKEDTYDKYDYQQLSLVQAHIMAQTSEE